MWNVKSLSIKGKSHDKRPLLFSPSRITHSPSTAPPPQSPLWPSPINGLELCSSNPAAVHLKPISLNTCNLMTAFVLMQFPLFLPTCKTTFLTFTMFERIELPPAILPSSLWHVLFSKVKSRHLLQMFFSQKLSCSKGELQLCPKYHFTPIPHQQKSNTAISIWRKLKYWFPYHWSWQNCQIQRLEGFRIRGKNIFQPKFTWCFVFVINATHT